MARILTYMFAACSVAALWTSFGCFLFGRTEKKNRTERMRKAAAVCLLIFLVFFVLFGISRNFDMPHWNV